MKALSKPLAALWVLTLTAALAACSDSGDAPAHGSGAVPDPGTPLAELVEGAQAQIPQLIDLFDDIYSDIRILGESDDTLIYEYDYIEQLDPDGAVAGLESQVSLLEATCESQVFPGMIASGIPDPKVRYAYYNADGSLVWSYTCTGS